MQFKLVKPMLFLSDGSKFLSHQMKNIELVYIIEDDPISMILAKKRVELHPAFGTSLTFANGQEALNHLQSVIQDHGKLPNLILLDLNMPVMDGWRFLDSVTAIPLSAHIPTFILSSSIHPNDIDRSKSFEMVKGFISKPLTQVIMDEIANQLNKSEN